ncbi:hypothetical protein SeMB42_g00733 [Synchytrium endobioticum]|uniref:Uncharacterized protein n=1 Tax=Synchytrium endobioticum TaxID=286115 RepID=A0A507DQQ3_9FUNG|nr:hypothetical protein SeLEV6574_g07641 [Synchytrium endobioticum]TPX53537.1 hypothetical protein SeMB42_g00733 [Synchytrium endobioticum]
MHAGNTGTWTSSKDGRLKCFDPRTSKSSIEIHTSSPLLSLSVSASSRVVAAGTELHPTTTTDDDGNTACETAAKILFYDIRNTAAPLKEFADVHSDDITQVVFHPAGENVLLSGGTDGLLCLYTLDAGMCQDESLYQVIKEESVHKAGFFGPAYEYVYCTTHIETFALYMFEEADLIINYGQVRSRSSEHVTIDYLIDVIYDQVGQRLYLFTGSQTGNVGVFNSSLTDLELTYTLNGGHSEIVRGISWDAQANSLVSGGEDGIIALWRN